MSIATIALVCQLALLGYHQVTTLFDFYPFNGARHLERKERLAECGVNGLLMILPPLGFGFHIRALMIFGLVYYFVLFAIELIIWWIPCLTTPSGRWRPIYNRLLSWATSNFEKGDTLARWQNIHARLDPGIPFAKGFIDQMQNNRDAALMIRAQFDRSAG
jgi:hypothetical protein